MSFLVLSDCWWNLFWDYGSARFTDNIFLMNREHFSRREVFLWGGMQQVQGRFTGGVWLMGSWFALNLLSPRASSPLTFPALLTSPIIHLLAKGVLYKALHSFNVMWTFAKPPLYDQHQGDFEKVVGSLGACTLCYADGMGGGIELFSTVMVSLLWWHGVRRADHQPTWRCAQCTRVMARGLQGRRAMAMSIIQFRWVPSGFLMPSPLIDYCTSIVQFPNLSNSRKLCFLCVTENPSGEIYRFLCSLEQRVTVCYCVLPY